MSTDLHVPSSSTGLLRILPTRVRRNYRGGLLLDKIEKKSLPQDSESPESWIASTTRARNPGLAVQLDEGLTRLQTPSGAEANLAALLATSPELYLGPGHASRHGTELGFIAKLLDSAIRLHVQAHPTSEFARKFLASNFGKLEVYYILAVRPGSAGTLRLGFQHAPSRHEWRRIIEEQDIVAMDACFEPISVQPGEIYLVPGGLPHAIGDGVLMVEVMEPSDLVVRCEFEREGIIVPPAGRFMDRGLDFCLNIFDYNSYSSQQIRALCQLSPQAQSSGPNWKLDSVVGPEKTSCFEIQRLVATGKCSLPNDGRAKVIIQTRGSGSISTAGQNLKLDFGESCFAGVQARVLEFSANSSESEWLLCSPSLD